MKNFFHVRPPLTIFGGGNRLLAGHAKRPPFLCCFVGGHFGHIAVKVAAGVFQIAEQIKLPRC